MNEQDYSKREIDEKMVEIKDQLNRIEEQTKKTNGSVARAFQEISSLKVWRGYIAGIGSVVVALLIPILIALIQSGKL
jgi:hypothetical protein